MRDITSCTMSDLALDDARDVADQLRHAGAPAVAVGVLAVEPGARVDAPDRFAEGLRGDGARVDAHAADGPLALDDGDAFAQLGGLDGGALSGGTAADADEIELRVAHGPVRSCGAGLQSCWAVELLFYRSQESAM